MGTRHTQSVITKKGELKIKQYGQWDGYPSGQGIGILEYLRNGNLEKYQENLENIPPVTDEQVTEIDKDPNWKQEYPYLSRDCGSKIHQMIEDGEVKFVQLIDEEESRKWCEGFYTIDFSKNEFVVDWDGIHTFKLDALPTNEEFLAATKQTNKITAMKLPRRVFNSPLILFANFHDGTSVNLIRLKQPYANGKMYAIHNNAENREKHNGMFKTLEKAKDSFYSVVREIDRESALLKMEMTINY